MCLSCFPLLVRVSGYRREFKYSLMLCLTNSCGGYGIGVSGRGVARRDDPLTDRKTNV